ncbi:hypothetical protein [Hydrogenophaga sp. BPS33]|uniref:hypothetical protein n=1 Tax=Hydrogenophaga sp. BPS33 TaxID=2651974 RepID=UPI00135B2A99|nr:hypothetical protein [Hydrogenophaga sp. BPS33]
MRMFSPSRGQKKTLERLFFIDAMCGRMTAQKKAHQDALFCGPRPSHRQAVAL